MVKSIRYFLAALVAVIGFSLGVPTLAEAAGECKSLESKSACERRDDCVYVGSYKTSKGKKVSAYCRSKGGNAKKTKAGKKKTRITRKTRADAKDKVKKARAGANKKAADKKPAPKEKAKKTVKKKVKKTVKKKAEKNSEAKPESKTKTKKKVKKKVKKKIKKKAGKKTSK